MSIKNMKWILSCPANDVNFIGHLKSASVGELKEVEETLLLQEQVGFKVKTKLKVIQGEIRKRNIGTQIL